MQAVGGERSSAGLKTAPHAATALGRCMGSKRDLGRVSAILSGGPRSKKPHTIDYYLPHVQNEPYPELHSPCDYFRYSHTPLPARCVRAWSSVLYCGAVCLLGCFPALPAAHPPAASRSLMLSTCTTPQSRSLELLPDAQFERPATCRPSDSAAPISRKPAVWPSYEVYRPPEPRQPSESRPSSPQPSF